MKEVRKILFVSERRADYSRLKPIMKAVQASPRLKMQLVVTGMHLLKYFGETKKIVRQDGFKIDAILPTFAENDRDDGAAMATAIGKAHIGMARIFTRLKPDIIFAGFDIGANFAAAVTGMHMNIHVSHIQGGEVSGSIDELLRHGMTKFAHIHFAATEQSRKRIIRMGENPKYVFNVGSPSLDTIRSIDYLPKEKIAEKYGIDPKKRLVILSQHPVTSEVNHVVEQIKHTISAVQDVAAKNNCEVLAIYSNNDAGGKRIVAQLKKSGFIVMPNIVYEDFLRLLKVAEVLVGNASTGIHEAPSFGLPTVNIGTRQQSRERGKNVIDADYNKTDIEKAIRRALFDKKFRAAVKRAKNPYDNGDTAKKVVAILENIDLPPVQKVITY